jgi:mono/diheme cytochrome c family protein
VTTNAAPQPAGYKAGGCNSCHGENGEGNIIGPEIRFTPPDYSKAIVRGGRNDPAGMPTAMVVIPTATVSDADLDATISWLNAFPKPATGEGLYKAMCGNCHGPSMATGGSAPIGIIGKTKADVSMFVRNGNGTDFKNRKEYMPKFDATLLTEAELTLIQTYLQSI